MSESTGALDKLAFVARYGGVYEHSAWIAEQTFDNRSLPAFMIEDNAGRQPGGRLHSVDEAHALGAALASTLAKASDNQKMALIRAHPDLVGRAALAGELTSESTEEQSSAGLDHCSADELARFRTANASYRERFGFPFVLAVRGRDRSGILEVFEQRLTNDPATEFETALVEIDRIALLRLEALVGAD